MNIVEKSVILDGIEIGYTLEYKRVKNINLRIKQNKQIYVSTNRFVSQKRIEEFLILKKDFILNALKRFDEKNKLPLKQYYTLEELRTLIYDFSKEIYPYFENLGVSFPEIKFRKMTSCCGSCHFKNGVIIFNKNLVFVPTQCVKYVVCHEFTHFIVPNHSKKFYDELNKICPNHKELKKELNKISISKH